MFGNVSVSSSVSSSSNSEKTSFSCGSLGGGHDPCAICDSLSNLSRRCLSCVHDSSSGNGIGFQPHVTKCGGPQSWQLLGSWVLELDSVWRGCVVSSGKIGLLSVRVFLTVKDFGALWLLVFFLALFRCFSPVSSCCLTSLLLSWVRVGVMGGSS